MGKKTQLFFDLNTWYQRQKRVLPWRKVPQFYPVWISEMMLQQTQVSTVISYFERFMERFPTVDDLAAASTEEVLKYWAGLGYYSRARNIHRASQIIHLNGFPKDQEGWLKLPGVGPYSSGAILSIVKNIPIPIVDGNVERVLSRVFRIKEIDSKKSQIWTISRQWVEKANQLGIKPRDFNQSLMELGATVCTPKNPTCQQCPIQKYCDAKKHNEVELYPVKNKKQKFKAVRENLVAILNQNGKLILRQRQSQEWLSGLWDLVEELPVIKPVKLDTFQVKYVITTHQISREVKVLQVSNKEFSRILKKTNGKSVDLQNIDLPSGAAFKRCLKKIHQSVL